jgi:hypothetical protein
LSDEKLNILFVCFPENVGQELAGVLEDERTLSFHGRHRLDTIFCVDFSDKVAFNFTVSSQVDINFGRTSLRSTAQVI